MSRTVSLKRRLVLLRPLRTFGRKGVERSEALYLSVRGQIVGARMRPADDVAQAWNDLLEHPELSWVPPMWRSVSPTTEASPHAISAVERNLTVDIVSGPRGRPEVRLTTGKLLDRRVGRGVDPVTPMASVDTKLTVTAPTFERAVLELRDAVVERYGMAPAAHHRHAQKRRSRTLRLGRSIPSAR